jgi:hypothetical protein
MLALGFFCKVKCTGILANYPFLYFLYFTIYEMFSAGIGGVALHYPNLKELLT